MTRPSARRFRGDGHASERGESNGGRATLLRGHVPGAGRRTADAAPSPARLWDARTGEPVSSPVKHDKAIITVAFSPDGRSFITGSLDKTAQLRDVATTAPIGQPIPQKAMVWVV